MQTYIVGTHLKRIDDEALLMSTTIYVFVENSEKYCGYTLLPGTKLSLHENITYST